MRRFIITLISFILLSFLVGNYGSPVHSATSNIANWTWSSLKLVSDQSNLTSNEANVIVDKDFNVFVIWEEQATYTSAGDDDQYTDVICQRWNVFSEKYYAPVLISSTSTGAAYDPHCTIDSEGNIHVVWEDNTAFFKDTTDIDIMYRMWNASTETWTYPIMVSEGSNNSVDPVIGVSFSGEKHVFWTEQNFPQEIFHKANINNTWLEIEEISIESEGYDAIWPHLAIDVFENIHLTWTDFSDFSGAEAGTGSIFYKKYDNLLDSWLATTYISTESTEEAYRSKITSDSKGNPHVVWLDRTELPLADDGNFDIFYKTVNPLTFTWTQTEVISSESTQDCNFPYLILDPLDNFHFVWSDKSNYGASGTDSDIYYKFRNSTSELWGPLTLLTPESSSISDNPNFFCDHLGFIHLVWLDFMDILGADPDPDIFYKFLSGEPTTPILNPIIQNPSKPGELEIQWSDSYAATDYKIYRESSPITSTTGLSPLVTITQNEYNDTIALSGTYYYAITAENPFGESSLSNVESVTVDLSVSTTKQTSTSTSTTHHTSTTSPSTTPGFSLMLIFIGLLPLFRKNKRLK